MKTSPEGKQWAHDRIVPLLAGDGVWLPSH